MNLVVVGASLAGLRAVEAARRAGFTGTVTLIGAEPHLPYGRPPLSKEFLAPGFVDDSLVYRDEAALAGELGVELMLGRPATALDLEGRAVLVGDERVPFDGVVIATGSRVRTLATLVQAVQPAGVHTLRTVDDAHAVRRALDVGARRVVVIGAGFIGSEVASSARARGCEVTVLEAAEVPLGRALGETAGALVSALHAANGTTLRCGTSVTDIVGENSVEGVALSDGSELPADLVVVGVGAIPATEWLAGSGLSLDDGVVCSETLCAGPAGVYAAGDVARWPNRAFGRSMRLENWTGAAEQGAVAGRNAVEPGRNEVYETVPYFWSDWYSRRIQFVGVHEAESVETIGDPAAGRSLTLFGQDGRLVGALGVDAQSHIMKYRGMISRRASWEEALAFDPAPRVRPGAS